MVLSSPGVPGARPPNSSDASTLTISDSLDASIPELDVVFDPGKFDEFWFVAVIAESLTQLLTSSMNVANKKYRYVI